LVFAIESVQSIIRGAEPQVPVPIFENRDKSNYVTFAPGGRVKRVAGQFVRSPSVDRQRSSAGGVKDPKHAEAIFEKG
jgi:hypothetical protein